MYGKSDMNGMEVGAVAGAGALAYALYSWNKSKPQKRVAEEKYQGGEAYADSPKVVTGLMNDLKSMGGPKKIFENIGILLELVKEKGLPVDDKKMLVRSPCHDSCVMSHRRADGKSDCSDWIVARNLEDEGEAHKYCR